MAPSANLLDEKLITNAFVHIEGEQLNIVSLYLDQEFGQHHKFKVVLDYDIIKDSFMGNPLEQIGMIGKSLDIDLQQGRNSGGAYEFRGIIDKVYTEGREGKHGYLVIEGSSPTNLLERGKRLDIFSEMSLQQVFEEVTYAITNKAFSKYNKPVYNVPIDFLMQYYESDWEFLQRLSAISGETLFYTGRDLVFGQYKDWAATEVMYDREITHIQFGSRLLANTFTNYQYLPGMDDTITQESPATIENSNDRLNMAAQRGQDLVKKRPVIVPSALSVEDKGALDDMVTRRKTETAAQTIYVTGRAKTCAPRIGRLLTILMPDGMSESGSLGTYRIVKAKHSIDENHRYQCEFEAIPASLKFFPTPELKMPVVNSLRGTVIKNDDPDGLGRVRVEFPFAEDRQSATWMRVMTPSAGSSDIVNKNRGMVFVPEEGDQVMVGFEFGDPNRPFVMGSMFHGKNTEGGGINNAIKSMMFRSGIKFVFNDDEGSVHLEDPSGSTYDFDGKGNIAVNAVKNMNLTVGENMTIDIGENLDVSVGKDATSNIGGNQKTDVGETIEVSANERKENIDQNADINIGEKLTLMANEADMFANGGDFVIKCSGKALLQGVEDARISKG
ncbi:type VI secretion system secreted protein VgrG [Dysgonomonas sp. PFB1-18]|uniref:type VI secretion system Vgr family protein n=1 Tax=unclassified Dysgonomonas TaxID=2630389 RepID=UPI0013CFDD36|nr:MULTISPECIES: phage baseplate assembly protein V [unclassified Dysgonomonas]MDH6310039.1 type VI secretion system secreted protein VgrG [Dysgonomonas sp. PF1-14]MDH6339948.1 type VI secretion system secreted protein VgrG [Dysgonomonas sp. PF1-16]MDH6381596.1 type VI secretion system secreted protein VgrG [Dysgonomonas sp. PFB1-18]MDH6398767.1 type VI secretion system secreted protein VgrG [Dysgonomonas sp. PF1-23]NDV93612.1 hypothetical protein [Dysgonomonas sp. 521]